MLCHPFSLAKMIAVGIDIGGTKIETQLFDAGWSVIERRREKTPATYQSLVETVVEQIRWADAKAGGSIPAGIGAAGLINPKTGLALAANLPITGKPFPTDIEQALGRTVTYLNDCRALALSEAVFGAGRANRKVLSLIVGTGIGGGIAIDQSIDSGPTGLAGEFGHFAAPADVVVAHSLPIWPCGCGRSGCIETYVSGPGLQRLAKLKTGLHIMPAEIASRRAGDMAEPWGIWCTLMGTLIQALTLTNDPDIILLGGGISKIPDVIKDIADAAQSAQLDGFAIPPIALAEGGETSGARGAAYAAWQRVGKTQ